MRNTNSYPLQGSDFKHKLLKWSQRFLINCYLNSNENQYGSQTKVSFDCLAGVDAIKEFVVGPNSFDSLKSFYTQEKDWLFGFFSYDLKNETENLVSENPDYIEMPVIHFFIPRYVFEVHSDKVLIHHYCEDSEIEAVFSEINGEKTDLVKENTQALAVKKRVSQKDYLKNAEKIKQHILNGNIYELNYCQEFYVENAWIDPYNTYLQLNALSPTPFSCYYTLNEKYLISASPERFLKKTGDKLLSQPIKGTIRRGQTTEEDEELKKELRNNPKEQAENIMIVDLVRNDLARTAKPGSTTVDELFGIYTFRQVHQMISTVSSRLAEEFHLIDAIKEAFPMGSMTGAPKINAMLLIEQFEQTKRGLYSGAVGYINPQGDFDFNVVIRSILYNKKNKYLNFMVGSAITAESIIEKEYEECLVKAEAMLKVLIGKI